MNIMGVEFHGAGERPRGLMPGDFILTRGNALVNRLIHFGQKNSIYGVEPKYASLSHAILVTSEEGHLAEALTTGVVRTHIDDYWGKSYYIVKLGMSPEDRKQIVRFAEAVVNARTRYGFTTIASIILTLLTGSRLIFGHSGTAICSGFVSEALCRAGYIFPKPPSHMMPGDLGQMFMVKEDSY